MEIKLERVVLRDMAESDIEDYVRWFTKELAWADFDAPWEQEETDEETERRNWTVYYESVKDLPEEELRWKFEIDRNGRHIGWVSFYWIDENYEWIAERDIRSGQTVHHAIGIDLCEPDIWGGGIGTEALRGFIGYLFDHGADATYTQTWSGNARMLRCAEKLGFEECCRKVGIRTVRGGQYDGLTFRIGKDGWHG